MYDSFVKYKVPKKHEVPVVKPNLDRFLIWKLQREELNEIEMKELKWKSSMKTTTLI